MQPARRSKWPRILSTVLLVAIFSLGFWQRQNIIDWWLLSRYTPTIDASELATQTTMTDNGRKIFYLQKPVLQEKAPFYTSCEEGEATIVLGCYKPRSGIYILKVTDARLQGVEQVTAAHEMLHAAYDRLSFRDQKKVAAMLTSVYDGITDADIRAKIDQYKASDADITNELHSILGTEVANLPADLETYYQRYFTERSKVVSYATAYQAEFKMRKEKVIALDKQLKELEDQINTNTTELNAQEKTITTESSRLDGLLRQGLTDEYNQGVIAYNQSLKPYRALANKTRQLISDYKATLEQRNQLATEAQELEKALDSRIQTNVKDI